MLKLVGKFLNSEGKTHQWTFNDPDPNKSPEEIKALLEKLTTLNLFEKDGVKLFQQVVSAKFVQTIETPLFDLSSVPENLVESPAVLIDSTNTEVKAPIEQVQEEIIVEGNKNSSIETHEKNEPGEPLAEELQTNTISAVEDSNSGQPPILFTPKKDDTPQIVQSDRLQQQRSKKKKKKKRKKRR
ncbi:DUF2922 domain-containing protein [Enterococcus sp. AZ109]|uniref:DUF2922 domain-containing protein n=1 Tax=Enterococcus sp. AZ109 TaxID=2774634 RepID=UPI003F291479